MRSNLNTYNIYRTITGCFLILLVLFSAYSPGKYTAMEDNIPHDLDAFEGEHENNSDEDFKIVAYEAVLPVVHANLSVAQFIFFTLEVVFSTFIEMEESFHLPFISYFNTLFRLIISPNAP